jgi:hypothetical protein
MDHAGSEDTLHARRERAESDLGEVRRKRAAVLVDRDQAEAVTAAVAGIRARLHAGPSPQEKYDIVRMMVRGGTVLTTGEGRVKRAQVTIQVTWGDLLEGEDGVVSSVTKDGSFVR